MNDEKPRGERLTPHERKKALDRAERARAWGRFWKGALDDPLWYRHLPPHLRDGPEGNAEAVDELQAEGIDI